MSPTEWLQCYDTLVEGMENDEWYEKREIGIPDKIKEMVRNLKSDNEH